MGTSNIRHGSIRNLTELESTRKKLQSEIDSQKTLANRRQLGQFATPNNLAREITSFGLQLLKSNNIRFLEPAIGTGSFYSALLAEIEENSKLSAIGYESDKQFFNAAQSIWGESIQLFNADFTTSIPTEKVNLLICNPPYVRHHFLSTAEKKRLAMAAKDEVNANISMLAGLYCHFILLAHKWLAPGAICGWLIPSEFMDVNYGNALKEYLLNKVHLLRIHRYDPLECQFEDALVSSAVVWFKNEIVEGDYEVEFSFGQTHLSPLSQRYVKKSDLETEHKWTRFPQYGIRQTEKPQNLSVGDYFDVKRGLATGDNDFFILTKSQIEELGLDMNFFTPILPSPRKLKYDEVTSDKNGFPHTDPQLFLLNCTLDEDEVQQHSPNLWNYLQQGLDSTASKYLCKSRKIWYLQEHREVTPFLCSYMGRSNDSSKPPFRFILNHSNAVATNSYLMLYPKDWLADLIQQNPSLKEKIWAALKSITSLELTHEGREYGGGLKKIEPKELRQVMCPELYALFN